MFCGLPAVQYVEDCFANASLFHKALKEAFESFCNKQIASATMAQLMADYCNTLLKKVRPPPVAMRQGRPSWHVGPFRCVPARCASRM